MEGVAPGEATSFRGHLCVGLVPAQRRLWTEMPESSQEGFALVQGLKL